MAITQISNNVILDGTILPAKLNIASTLRTFLSSATSANLASAVSGTTGSGNLVFAVNPTFTDGITISSTGWSYASLVRGNTSSKAAVSFSTTGVLNSTTPAWEFGVTNGFSDFHISTWNGAVLTQRIAIMTDGRFAIGTTSPNASAMLQVDSTSRGFLPPRMTSTQRNAISGASVPSGLTVFNSTDNALSVYTTVLSSWDNIFTARASSFTADTLRNACSNDTGTGNLVFSDFPSLSSPTLISPVISSFYASSLPDTLSMCIRDGPIPKFRLFEDFGNAGVGITAGVGNNGFSFTSSGGRGGLAVYTQPFANRGINVLAHGINSLTTGNVISDTAYYLLALGGGGMVGCSGQYSFALSGTPVTVPNTIVDMRIGLNANVVVFEINSATGQLNVVQGGSVGSSTTTLLSGITLSGGNFSYGTRYRFYYKIISPTQVDVYFASAPFNSATWTAIYNGVATIPAMTLNGTENLVYPYFGLRTSDAVAKTMYIDWIAVEKDITR